MLLNIKKIPVRNFLSLQICSNIKSDLQIKVKPNSNKQKIQNLENNNYLVCLKSPPENNKANSELINLLSKYFSVPIASIKIKRGMHSNKKVVEVRQ